MDTRFGLVMLSYQSRVAWVAVVAAGLGLTDADSATPLGRYRAQLYVQPPVQHLAIW